MLLIFNASGVVTRGRCYLGVRLNLAHDLIDQQVNQGFVLCESSRERHRFRRLHRARGRCRVDVPCVRRRFASRIRRNSP